MTATFSQERPQPTTVHGVLKQLRDYFREKRPMAEAEKRRRQLSERRGEKK